MIGNYLKRKKYRAAVKGGIEDFQSVLAALRGMNSDDIGAVVARAHLVRRNFTKNGLLPELNDNFLSACVAQGDGNIADDVGIELGNFVRFYQREKMSMSASSTMIWQHSYRAVVYAELRQYGREMWLELRRGFPYAAKALSIMAPQEPLGVDEIYPLLSFVPPELDDQY